MAAATVGVAGACANQVAPPGGPEDRRPPVVVRTEPDTFGEILRPDGEVRFHFDERISERTTEGDLSSAVSVSPLTGEVRVDHGRTSLTVSLEGGFRPGLVYRVTLLPVVSDLFGNRMTNAFEIVFSTGGEAEPTGTLAGEVWDRVSGSAVNRASVQAVGADSLVHVARADDDGVFAFRYLPAGDFVVTAFEDVDRDRRPGPREDRGSVPVSVGVGDTLVVDIPVLAPDTTPAVPAGASALDSVTVVVEFDDYLDPSASADQIGIRLTREEGEAPLVTRLFHEVDYAEYVDRVADSLARLDSLDAAVRAEEAAAAAAAAAAAGPTDSVQPTVVDSTVVDSAAVDSATADAAPADSLPQPRTGGTGGTGGAATQAAEPQAADTVPARPGPPRLEGAVPRTPAPRGLVLPGRRLVGLLDEPLEAGEYQIRVTSVVNINGLPDGGGEVVLSYEPPPPPADSTSRDDGDDTGGDPADSAAVVDSLGLLP